MSKFSFVYFDVGGVFLDWSNVFTNVASDFGTTQRQILDVFDKYDESITKGQLKPDQFWQKIQADLGLRYKENYDFLSHWVAGYKPIRSTYTFVESLSGKIKLGIISNIYKNMFPTLIKNHIIPAINFDSLVLSCEVGMMKPEANIYKLAQEKARVNPSTILYVDDSAKYLSVPQQFGWQTYLFDTNNPEQSITDIAHLLQL